MSNWADVKFLSNGMQYYVAGRFAMLAESNPVAANILHHAVENFLKGALAKAGATLPELKSHGHNLQSLWSAFRLKCAGPSLTQYDAVILALQAFEEIRYPDLVVQKGMQSTFNITRPTLRMGITWPSLPPPKYELCLQDIDELVEQIFTSASLNPKAFSTILSRAEYKFLTKENVVSSWVVR
jgi:hypothetical protein